MSQRSNFKIYPLLIMGLFLVFTSNCKKDDNSPDNPNDYNEVGGFNPNVTYGTMTDQDGNEYKTVKIGNQTWMAENLRTTKYRDGSAIPVVSSKTAWVGLTTGAYCNYNNTASADTINAFGRLYNWYAATDARNIAPTGWHVPTDDDWTILTDYLGGEDVSGDKIKETGITHWFSANLSSTNETGFTARPGGYRNNDGVFYSVGKNGYWWSTTESTPSNAWFRYVSNLYSNMGSLYGNAAVGFSVRCVKD